MHATGIFLHGFGPRYDLPAPLFWYLFAAAGVVVISFVLVVAYNRVLGLVSGQHDLQ